MSNGSNDLSGAISNLIETMGKLAQQQVELINTGLKTAAQMAEPLSKTATDLLGNMVSTMNQMLQTISSAIAPKQY
uniref:Chlorosome envelope protein B n=1 Tax=Chlorobium chlorochromatii (strain CaD3) TaxID=340177 RepID=Q3AU56_CHLCH